MQLAQHDKVIWSPESHIYATIEADKTFYLYLIQKILFLFYTQKKCVFFSNKSQQKTILFCIYLKMSLYGYIKQVLMYMSGKFEVCSYYTFFQKHFIKLKNLNSGKSASKISNVIN